MRPGALASHQSREREREREYTCIFSSRQLVFNLYHHLSLPVSLPLLLLPVEPVILTVTTTKRVNQQVCLIGTPGLPQTPQRNGLHISGRTPWADTSPTHTHTPRDVPHLSRTIDPQRHSLNPKRSTPTSRTWLPQGGNTTA